MRTYLYASVLGAILSVSAMTMIVRAQGNVFANDLSMGVSGDDVVSLQTWLITHNFDIPSISGGFVDKGYFGKETQAALIRYQESVGLPTTGFFGPLTRTSINGASPVGQNSNSQGQPWGSRGQRSQSLHVLLPNGGEIWQSGTTQYIRWAASLSDPNQTADIRLEFPTPPCAQPGQTIRCLIMVRAPLNIASGVKLSSGSYAWHVGDVHLNGCPLLSQMYPNSDGTSYCTGNVIEGQYKVQVCPTDGSPCDESDNYFNVSSAFASSTPSISMISPNGGEIIVRGGTYAVQWNSYGLTNSTISLFLIDGSKSCQQGYVGCLNMYTIASGLPNTGTYSWNTDSQVSGPVGQNNLPVTPGTLYKMKVCADQLASVCDVSNTFFTIVGEAPVAGNGSSVVYGSAVSAPMILCPAGYTCIKNQ